MESRREGKSKLKDANRDACSGLGTHTYLTLQAMPFRWLLLNEAVAGVDIEGETVWAAEFRTPVRFRKRSRVIAEDRILGRLVRGAVPVVNGCAGEHAVVVDDECGRDVGQKCPHLWQLTEQAVSRALQDERAPRIGGVNEPDGFKQAGVENVRDGRVICDRAQYTADAPPMRVLVLAGAASDGRAARSAHHLDNVGNGGVAHGREHGRDELRCDKCPLDDLHVNQAW
jgi:hypothetical protein